MLTLDGVPLTYKDGHGQYLGQLLSPRYLKSAYLFWRRLWVERSSMLEGFHFSSLALPRTILSLYHSTDGAHTTRKRNDKTPLDKLHI